MSYCQLIYRPRVFIGLAPGRNIYPEVYFHSCRTMKLAWWCHLIIVSARIIYIVYILTIVSYILSKMQIEDKSK